MTGLRDIDAQRKDEARLLKAVYCAIGALHLRVNIEQTTVAHRPLGCAYFTIGASVTHESIYRIRRGNPDLYYRVSSTHVYLGYGPCK